MPNFLSGFNAKTQLNQQADLGQLQQVGALQGILAKVQAAKEEEGIKGILAQSQGDPAKAVQGLVQFGSPRSLDMASKLKGMMPKPAEPYTLGNQRYGPNNELLATAPFRPNREQNPSDLSRAQTERGAMQLGDPRIPAADNYIRKLSETVKQISPTIVMPRNEPAIQTHIDGKGQLWERDRGGSWRRALGFDQTQPGEFGMPLSGRMPAAEAGKPSTYIAKLNDDLAKGRITKEQYDSSLLTQGYPVPSSPAEEIEQPTTTAAPDNLDTRDIRLRGPVSADQRAAQVLPPMPAEIASARPRAQEAWKLQQTRPSIAGNAPITPETATRLAQQMLSGDSNALAGMARNQTGLAQVQNEITRLAAQTGKTGSDITGAKAMTAANRTALTAVTKDMVAITPFKEMLDQNAQIAMALGRKIADDKTNSAFVNRPLLWVKNNLSNRPDIAEYLAQMHFVEVEAARVLTQPRLVGQLTDQAISDMKSVVSGNMTIASTEAVLNRIMADGNNRINAMKNAQARTLAEIKGQPPKTREADKATGVDTNNPLLR